MTPTKAKKPSGPDGLLPEVICRRLVFACAAIHDHGPSYLVVDIKKQDDGSFKAVICMRFYPTHIVESGSGVTEQGAVDALQEVIRKELKKRLAKLRKATRVMSGEQDW